MDASCLVLAFTAFSLGVSIGVALMSQWRSRWPRRPWWRRRRVLQRPIAPPGWMPDPYCPYSFIPPEDVEPR